MKGLIYIVIYIVGVVVLLIIVEKKYTKQMTEIKKAGMRSDTMIEFQEQEIPIQNTNPPNDIYKKDDSAKGIMYGMMLFFSVCFGIIGWILEGFGRYCFWIFAVWSFFGMVCTFSNRRERILSKGTPYPAVIVKVESYIDTEHVNKTNVKVPKYSMEIHYGDSQKWVMKGISITGIHEYFWKIHIVQRMYGKIR